jgi:hypothetical protein
VERRRYCHVNNLSTGKKRVGAGRGLGEKAQKGIYDEHEDEGNTAVIYTG